MTYGKGFIAVEQYFGRINGDFPLLFMNTFLACLGSCNARSAWDKVRARKFSIPARSPDLNSIEKMFHSAKGWTGKFLVYIYVIYILYIYYIIYYIIYIYIYYIIYIILYIILYYIILYYILYNLLYYIIYYIIYILFYIYIYIILYIYMLYYNIHTAPVNIHINCRALWLSFLVN